MTNKPKVGDIIDGKEVTGVFWPWVKFGNVCGEGWVRWNEVS